MKKQEFPSTSLKLKKVNIANLELNGGAKTPESIETHCCTKHPYCQHTVTTRPDSIAGS